MSAQFATFDWRSARGGYLPSASVRISFSEWTEVGDARWPAKWGGQVTITALHRKVLVVVLTRAHSASCLNTYTQIQLCLLSKLHVCVSTSHPLCCGGAVSVIEWLILDTFILIWYAQIVFNLISTLFRVADPIYKYLNCPYFKLYWLNCSTLGQTKSAFVHTFH